MMFNLTYDQILNLILEKSNISKEELESKINDKLKELSDLVSREGAAHIIANELNVKLSQEAKEGLKIKDLMPGMRLINLNAKVLNIYETREFQKQDRKGRLKAMSIGDETGIIRLVIWDDNIINKASELKENDIIKVKGAYCKENNSFKELHMGSNTHLDINPEGISIGEVSFKREMQKKKISELNENDNAEIMGTIIQIFEPKTYEVCPLCNKRTPYQNEKYVCDEHGIIEPKLVPLINFYVDDGSSNIRVVAFREQAEKIMNKSIDVIKTIKTDSSKFEELKNNIVGKQFSLKGRATSNMFNNIEFIANEVEEINKVEMESIT